jgi:hypothetical protein
MSQRNSGRVRQPDELYETPDWVTRAAASQMGEVACAWDPFVRRGASRIVATLTTLGIKAVGTTQEFFSVVAPLPGADLLISNPPYGPRGTLAEKCIAHALELGIPRVVMLLRNDFDSAIGRPHLFRHDPRFAFKIVLLGRIKWFEGPSSPSDNHSWFCWSHAHAGPPTIRYVSRWEVDSLAPALGMSAAQTGKDSDAEIFISRPALRI